MDELRQILKNSIEGEIIVNYKYLLFSKQALQENLPMIAHIFKTIGQAEKIHIEIHKSSLARIEVDFFAIRAQIHIDKEALKEQLNSTKVNLLNSRVSETFEFLDRYRNFALIAKKYKKPFIEENFSILKRAERSHAELFQDYLIFLDEHKEMELKSLFICQKCGTVRTNIPTVSCPGCENDPSSYKEVTP